MKDWKTTITGVVTGVVLLLGAFGFHIPQDVQAGIVSIGIFAIGYFAKDATKEGN